MASLYDAHSAIVYSIAFRILQDAASAENVLQDIFLAIWRDPASFVTARDKLKVWLGIVARARAVTLLRMRRDKCSTGVIPLGGPDTLPTHVEGQLTVEQARMSAARIVQRRAWGVRDGLF